MVQNHELWQTRPPLDELRAHRTPLGGRGIEAPEAAQHRSARSALRLQDDSRLGTGRSAGDCSDSLR